MLTIEGPRFSSKAESKLWHSWGADTVNMTTVPEVSFAVIEIIFFLFSLFSFTSLSRIFQLI